MSALFHSYLCGRKAAEWLINMIICNRECAEMYEGLNPHFKEVFSHIANIDCSDLPPLVQTVNNVCTVYLQSFTSQGATEHRYEIHKKYIDIHYTISGEEHIGFAGFDCNVAEILQPYNTRDDIEFLRCSGSVISLCPGEMAIVFPGEIHAPKAHIESGQEVLKLVIKVPIV